jgi:hypothetical protein
MLRRPLYILVAMSFLFTFGSVGASVINLDGSDPAPGEGTTTGRCAKDIYISVPVTNDNNNGEGNDLKVVHVNVTGDFSECNNGWMRVTAQLNPSRYAYAVAQLDADQSEYSFLFDHKTGNFHDEHPLWINNELVNQGKRLNPPNKLDISEISVVAALTWE